MPCTLRHYGHPLPIFSWFHQWKLISKNGIRNGGIWIWVHRVGSRHSASWAIASLISKKFAYSLTNNWLFKGHRTNNRWTDIVLESNQILQVMLWIASHTLNLNYSTSLNSCWFFFRFAWIKLAQVYFLWKATPGVRLIPIMLNAPEEG